MKMRSERLNLSPFLPSPVGVCLLTSCFPHFTQADGKKARESSSWMEHRTPRDYEMTPVKQCSAHRVSQKLQDEMIWQKTPIFFLKLLFLFPTWLSHSLVHLVIFSIAWLDLHLHFSRFWSNLTYIVWWTGSAEKYKKEWKGSLLDMHLAMDENKGHMRSQLCICYHHFLQWEQIRGKSISLLDWN